MQITTTNREESIKRKCLEKAKREEFDLTGEYDCEDCIREEACCMNCEIAEHCEYCCTWVQSRQEREKWPTMELIREVKDEIEDGDAMISIEIICERIKELVEGIEALKNKEQRQ